VALTALDTEAHLLSASGQRRLVAVCDLHRWPGDRPEIETVLRPGELITAVELPPSPCLGELDHRRDSAPRASSTRAWPSTTCLCTSTCPTST
jgi:xanthine dehydrogenase YagS FAD-binding subunit